jgi:hypothetical protein
MDRDVDVDVERGGFLNRDQRTWLLPGSRCRRSDLTQARTAGSGGCGSPGIRHGRGTPDPTLVSPVGPAIRCYPASASAIRWQSRHRVECDIARGRCVKVTLTVCCGACWLWVLGCGARGDVELSSPDIDPRSRSVHRAPLPRAFTLKPLRTRNQPATWADRSAPDRSANVPKWPSERSYA